MNDKNFSEYVDEHEQNDMDYMKTWQWLLRMKRAGIINHEEYDRMSKDLSKNKKIQ